MAQTLSAQTLSLVVLCAWILGAEGSGERTCNIPETGTLTAGDSSAPYSTIRLGSGASTDDNYYAGSKISITSGTGVGATSTVSAYCGKVHTSCTGLDSSGTLAAVSFNQETLNGVTIASTLKLTLPATDGGGRTTPTSGDTTCTDRLTMPYMTSYSSSCSGTYKGLNIYVIEGTGAGSVGLIRAGPDSNRQILVTGIFGYCWSSTDQTTKGGKCVSSADCTGDAVCQNPVDSSSRYTISNVPSVSGTCNPLCNNVASFTATVDFKVATDTTSVYSIQRGCYDQRYAAGMRRLGSSGSAAGSQTVDLAWKVLIPDGEIIGRPASLSDGSVIVATARGSLNRISAEGERMWSIYVGSVLGNVGVGEDDTIYFGSGDRNIWAVSAHGITRWRYTTQMPVHASPLVTLSGIYVGDRTGIFYKFNLDGSVAWKYQTGGEILGGSAMTRDGKIIFGSMDKFLYCLDSTTGAPHWFVWTDQEIVGTPLIQDVSIVFGTRENDEEYGQIIALKMDGTVRWNYTVTSSIESEPTEGSMGEVYVSTSDGKIFAIQADGQLKWKYNTGGTGGVCKPQQFLSESRTIATGDEDPTDSTSVTLSSDASASTSFYNGYRAKITLASGTVQTGQFVAVSKTEVVYAPTNPQTSGIFTDISGVDTALVVKFSVKDRMIGGEKISLPLYGFSRVNTDSTLTTYPGMNSTVAAGKDLFASVSGTARNGTVRSVVLDSSAHCGSTDDACTGAMIKFTSGTGSGQTATIVKYYASTLTAMITTVGIAPDSTTTYTIGSTTTTKFMAGWNAATTPGTLEITVKSISGVADCTSDCTQNRIRLAVSEDPTAGIYDGWTVEFVNGTGVGQVTKCVKYYGDGDNKACLIDTVAVAPSSDTLYRVSPIVEGDEEVTVVVAFGHFTYPHFSGSFQGTPTTTSLQLAATASSVDSFYKNMQVEVFHDVSPTLVGSTYDGEQDLTFNISARADASYIGVGTYLRIDDEVVKVTAIDGATLTVLRGQLVTAASNHSAGSTIKVIEYATISAYTGATTTATVSTLLYAPAASASYRVRGINDLVSLKGSTTSDFTTSPFPVVVNPTPSEYSATTSLTLGGEIDFRNDFYVGATLVITDGPGKGMQGEIANHTSGTVIVTFDYSTCGGPFVCSPKGSSDNGYVASGFTPTSAYKLSQYEIFVTGTVTSYTSARVATIPVTAKVSSTYKYCSSFESSLQRYCTVYSTTSTPIFLEWASGGWCSSGGGTGWGATSPCYAAGLVVTTSANKFVYGLGTDGTVKFKYMTGKRIKSPARCVTNADRSVTVYTGSNDHHVYRLDTDPQKILRGSSWYSQ